MSAAHREIVLYRCRMPTNYLCPCGGVERRLRKLAVEHRTERVSQRRNERPEIEELTGQKRVPVLVDGEEVISDSRRIIEYLEFVNAPADEEAEGRDEPAQADA